MQSCSASQMNPRHSLRSIALYLGCNQEALMDCLEAEIQYLACRAAPPPLKAAHQLQATLHELLLEQQ
jgi:hypothetical protein